MFGGDMEDDDEEEEDELSDEEFTDIQKKI